MKTLYTDAGFDYRSTDNTPEGKPVIGRICVADGEGFSRIELAGIGKVPSLRQYINVFELTAIARAIEIAIEKGWTGNLAIYTDSKVAMIWASYGIKDSSKKTEAHISALEYLRTARKNYIGIVTYNHVGRDNNPAGKLLEVELEKDRQARRDAREVINEEPEPISRGGIELVAECDCDCHRSPTSDDEMKLHGCDICASLHE